MNGIPWTEQAVCRSMDPDIMFPIQDQQVRNRKRLCGTCPVIDYCRIQGIGERNGIYGGMSGKDRVRMRNRLGVQLGDPYVNPFVRVADRAWERQDPTGVLAEYLGQANAWKVINDSAA